MGLIHKFLARNPERFDELVIKSQKEIKSLAPKHENTDYCRKRCKLYKINECWSKTIEGQLNCKHYGESL